MRISADNLVLAAILSLSAAAATLVAIDHFVAGEEDVGRRFQAAVGGLGLGPQANLSRCSWQFDPRLAGDDDAGLEALLGIEDYNPWHALAMFPVEGMASGDGLD